MSSRATIETQAPLDVDFAWNLIGELRTYWGPDASRLRNSAKEIVWDETASRGYRTSLVLTDDARQLLDLFVPLCLTSPASSFVAAHLAQSLDGRIATESGESKFISDEEDVLHTHRMRALFDAVVVGAGTVLHDDPLLTARLAPGPNPTRVIIAPGGNLPPKSQLLKDNGPASIVIVARGASYQKVPGVDFIEIELEKGILKPSDILATLYQRGLKRIFVEGGGVTISHFLEAQLLDRLHVAIAPTIIGSWRPSFHLSPIAALDQRLQFNWYCYQLGRDILLDCCPKAHAPADSQ